MRQSRGIAITARIDGAAHQAFDTGRELYFRRAGQMNLACVHCHEASWGKRLRPELISQGNGTGYPLYRFEWQWTGSPQRRLRACFFGLRAAVPEFGLAELGALELFLAWRAEGLAMEAPGVRR